MNDEQFHVSSLVRSFIIRFSIVLLSIVNSIWKSSSQQRGTSYIQNDYWQVLRPSDIWLFSEETNLQEEMIFKNGYVIVKWSERQRQGDGWITLFSGEQQFVKSNQTLLWSTRFTYIALFTHKKAIISKLIYFDSSAKLWVNVVCCKMLVEHFDLDLDTRSRKTNLKKILENFQHAILTTGYNTHWRAFSILFGWVVSLFLFISLSLFLYRSLSLSLSFSDTIQVCSNCTSGKHKKWISICACPSKNLHFRGFDEAQKILMIEIKQLLLVRVR